MYDNEKIADSLDLEFPEATAHASGIWPARPDALPDFPPQARELRSAAAHRAEAREQALAMVVEDVLVSAQGPDEVSERLTATVWGNAAFARLPLHRRRFVEGFYTGMQAAQQRASGLPSRTQANTQARVPEAVRRLQSGAIWHRHTNGGGWVAHTAYVQESAYVGPGCRVFNYARILENARLRGEALVLDEAVVRDYAQVRGDAAVGGRTVLGGKVVVGSGVVMTGDAVLTGRQTVRSQREADRAEKVR